MRKLLVFAALLILAGGLRAQNVSYDNTALKASSAIPDVHVAVCQPGANTSVTPCSPLATIYINETSGAPAANPFQADSYGNYQFWGTPGGHYVVQTYGPGLVPVSKDVFLPAPNLTNAALKPAASDAVLFVSPNGSDSNDGLSWGSAKKTLYAAVTAAMAQASNSTWTGAEIDVASHTACGGPISGQGLWLFGSGSSPGSGWIHMTGPLTLVGRGIGVTPQNQPSPVVDVVCGSSTQPALRFQSVAWASPVTVKNIAFTGSEALTVEGSSTLLFDNDTFSVESSVPANGPAVKIGDSSFWLFFNHCGFYGNTNAGKPTDGSDSAEAFVVNPGAGNNSSGLIYIDEGLMYNGDLKYYPGGTTWGFEVRGLSTENQSDGKGAVWFPTGGGNGPGQAYLSGVDVSDATVNPTAAVQNDNTSWEPSQVLVTEAYGYGKNVLGPARVEQQYLPNLQNLTALPLVQGQTGPLGGKSFDMTDAGRRLFAPTASQFANLAQQLPSQWSALNGGVTASAVAAPDGTSNAGQINNTNGFVSGMAAYNANLSVSNNDYLVFGVWSKNWKLNSGVGGIPGLNTCSGVTATVLLGTPNSWIQVASSGDWEWWSFVEKVDNTNGTATSCSVTFPLIGDANTANAEYYAPTMYYIAAGTVTDSEAVMLGLNLAPYPDSLAPPVEATLRGHPFAFGGSGDNYFATLDHTTLAGNQTYILPSVSGQLLASVYVGTVAGPTAAIASGTCATTITTSVSGATTSSKILATPNADPAAANYKALTVYWFPTAGNIHLEVCNPSAASVTPTALTFNVSVVE